jgi:hypothetical protein
MDKYLRVSSFFIVPVSTEFPSLFSCLQFITTATQEKKNRERTSSSHYIATKTSRKPVNCEPTCSFSREKERGELHSLLGMHPLEPATTVHRQVFSAAGIKNFKRRESRRYVNWCRFVEQTNTAGFQTPFFSLFCFLFRG